MYKKVRKQFIFYSTQLFIYIVCLSKFANIEVVELDTKKIGCSIKLIAIDKVFEISRKAGQNERMETLIRYADTLCKIACALSLDVQVSDISSQQAKAPITLHGKQ